MRTSNDHEIDTFSLGEDGRKDANVGMDSQNNVGFVLCVGWKTLGTGEFYCVLASHPSRVRGLKRYDRFGINDMRSIAPFAGARIETDVCDVFARRAKSHPSRVRGLKPRYATKRRTIAESHPSRVRGLKLIELCDRDYARQIAPFAGARIETRVCYLHRQCAQIAPFAGARIECECVVFLFRFIKKVI